MPSCALRRKKSGRRAAATLSAPAPEPRHAASAGEWRHRRPVRRRFARASENSARAAAERAKDLRVGLPLSAFASGSRETDKEILVLVRRLAGRGLIEYRLGRARGEDLVVIEPQLPDYWPQLAQLGNADTLVLSRFAYMRRRADELVLESPRAGALFKICDPKIAAALALLVTPQQIKQFRRASGFSRARASLPPRRLPNPFQDRPTAMACGRPRATTPSCCGTSTISCSTRAAPRAGTPIRCRRRLLLTRTPSRRCRPCAPPWPGKRSICAISVHGGQVPSAAASSCANVIRRAISTTSSRSRSPSWRDFSTAPPASSRNSKTPLDRSRSDGGGPDAHLHGAALSVGRRQLRARALSRRRHMRRAAARLLSLRRRRATRWCRSSSAAIISTRCSGRRICHGRERARRKS